MSKTIGYKYPLRQGLIYAIRSTDGQGIFTLMDQTFKAALDHALVETGRSLKSIADAAGVSYEQLKNLKQGKAQRTNVDDAMKVAAAFGVSLEDFYRGKLDPADRHPVAVAGTVGAGAKVPLTDAYAKGDGLYHVAAPEMLMKRGARKGIVAVEVEGDSMAPMYQPGDVLFYARHTHEGIPDEDIGRPCVVEDADGMVWVKQVKRGTEPGLFHLISLNPAAETRHNVRIKWAARVMLALPAEMVERI
ncbi:S24 family peptidase [Paracoccus sp. (in: a-proteobacteria)]|uniref:S24 family peptidase n=1 Tax=Paracoccus sp. TaxID=267 RepID=UPI00289F5C0F|nr:S24 family peptidase [Paracoccus sp. (in: a-proteobacteria)]